MGGGALWRIQLRGTVCLGCSTQRATFSATPPRNVSLFIISSPDLKKRKLFGSLADIASVGA
jgi:hypothetical protein